MKTLITAAVIKQHAQSGIGVIEFTRTEYIVTPEAFEVAKELGVALVDVGQKSAAGLPEIKKERFSCGVKPNLFSLSGAPLVGTSEVSAEFLKQVRLAVIAQLPSGSVPETLVDQLVLKVINEQKNAVPQAKKGTGVKCVAGSAIKLEAFPGQPPVGIADAITIHDGSSMAAGMMAWENHAFPWLLNYDEVDYIIDGELHLRCDGELTIARAGDVLFIPKGSKVEFATPTTVKFFYVTYPADWQNQ